MRVWRGSMLSAAELIINLVLVAFIFALVWYLLSLRGLKKRGEYTEERRSQLRRETIKTTVIFAVFYLILQLIWQLN